MSIAAYLAKLSEGVNSSGILATSKGGTGTTSGGAFPTITSISYGGDNNDTATDTSGGRTVTITGANFAANATILINGVAAPVVSVVSASTITFTTPAMAAGTYVLYMVNADGSTAIAVPGISYSGVPAWSTVAGIVATVTETTAISASLGATSNSAVTLSVLSGTLPPGAVFNSNGTISGTSAITASPTTYTFTVRATDTELQDTDRQFSIVINPDVITFTNPVGSSTVTLNQNENNFVTLAATTTTGNTIASYSANTLPPGMTLTGSTVSGVPTTLGTTSTTLTATSSTTAKTGTSTFTWSVIVGGDLYWKNTALLLPGTALVDNFVTDYSVNNFQPTIFGDTRASPLNPYQTGYYSNQFSTGQTNYIQTTIQAMTGNFTVECWVYLTSLPNSGVIIGYTWEIWINTSNQVVYYTPASARITTSLTVPLNAWTHVALVRSSGVAKIYINGVADAATYTDSGTVGNLETTYIGRDPGASGGFNGNISNLRIVNGTAVYTANFTPATAPLTAISGTTLLTCQANRFIDAGPNNYAITRTGTSPVQPFNPFGVPASTAINNLYSTYFDGTGDYLTAPSNAIFGITGSWSVEVMLYVTGGSSQNYPTGDYADYVVDFRSGDTLNAYLGIAKNASGNIVLWGGMSGVDNLGTTTLSLNTWYYLAYVYNGTTLKGYLNGSQELSQTVTRNMGTNSPTIGARFNRTEGYIQGYLSNFRLVTSAITPTTPTAPLTAITNTSLLTCQDATIRDNSVNAFAITSVGQAQPIAQSPFTQTTTTVPLTTVGSAYFDGTGDQLTYVNNPLFAFFTGNFTVECWLYPLSAGGQSVMNYTNGQSSNSNFAWEMYQNNGTQIQFTIIDSDGATGYTAQSAGLLINSWNHIAAVRNGNTMSIYVNGVVGGTTVSVTGVSVFNKSGATLKVSGWNNATGMYTGYIEDVRIVKGTALYTANFFPPVAPLTAVTNTSLLTLQTQQPSNNSQFIDNSPAANLVTRTGNTTQGTFAPYGANWSGYFNNSTADNIVATSIASYAIGTGNFTVEAFVNFNAWTGTQRIFTLGVTGTDGLSFVRPNANSLETAVGGVYPITYAWTPNVGQWYHIALVRSGTGTGQLALYIDGLLVATATSTGSIGQNQINIGGISWQAQNMQGFISNFRFSNIARTIAVPTAPYQPDANTLLLTCQDNRFVDNSPLNNTITRNGSATTQRFSPFGSTVQTPVSYSTYLTSATDSRFTVPAGTAFAYGTGDFTVEFWFLLPTMTQANLGGMFFTQSVSGTNYFVVGLGASGTTATGTIGFTGTTSGGGTGISSGANLFTAGTWNHGAVCRVSGIVTVYLNGQGGTPTSNTMDFTNVTYVPTIGGYTHSTANNLNGYLSNFRIVKGTAVYTANFTPPTAPLTAISGTSLLTCQSTTIRDNSTNALTVTSTGSATPKTINPFGYTNAQGSAYTPALYGASAYFDGTGDYLTSPVSSSYGFGTGNWTLEGWVYLTDNTRYNAIFDTRVGTGTQAGSFGMGISTTGRMQLYASGATYFQPTESFDFNSWNHFAVVKYNNVTKMYKNGTAFATTYADTRNYGSSQPIQIGNDDAGGVNAFKGYISDLKITKGQALYTSNFVPPQSPLTTTTATTLLLNMDKAAVTDYTKLVNLETVGDAKITTESAYNGLYYSNYFDGTADYLTVPANNAFVFGTGDYTVEAWIYTPSFTPNSYIVQNLSVGNVSWGLEIYNNLIRWVHMSPIILSATAPSVNSWHHVAVARSGTTLSMFIDGVRGATATDSTNLSSNNPVLIGHYPSLAYTGNISNLRIVKGTAVYNPALTTCTVPTGPLTAISGTSLLTCQSNKFFDASTNAAIITRSGDVAVKSFNPFQRNTKTSMYFDGTGDALPIPYNPVLNLGAGNFTIEFWSYVNATPTTEGYFFTIGPAGSGAANRGLRLAVHNGTAAGIYFSALGIGSETLLGSFPTAGVWNHIAFVRNGTTVTGYVNGIALGTTFNASTTSITEMSSGDYSFVAGLNSSGGTPRLFYNGYLEDLRVTRGVARYTANFTPPTAKLQTK